jgi:hypothetical protein
MPDSIRRPVPNAWIPGFAGMMLNIYFGIDSVL